MMTLADQRRSIRHLLDFNNPADGLTTYFAFYHADANTTLRPYPAGAKRAEGYVCLSRTGMDLFRPLVTMRLPIQDMETSAEIIYRALEPGIEVILSVPENYGPLMRALFEVQSEETLQLYALRATEFEPIVNVLITEDKGTNGLPRYVIRDRQNDVLAAFAGLNWQSPNFAEISVSTHVKYRRQGYGRSVVAAMANTILSNGRTPLYAVSEQNNSSILLAQRVGFKNTLNRILLIYGKLNPRPIPGK